MKRILLFAIIFAINIVNAQETYRFNTDAIQGFTIESSRASGLSLHYSIAEITVSDVINSDAEGQEIILKGSFGSFAEGLPNLPFENRYIAVPQGAKVSIKVKENGCQTLNGIDLVPAAKVMLNNDDGLPKFQKNMSVFGKDANFPAENVTIAQATKIRGLDVIMLNVTPFRYNPVKKTLEVIYDMDIEVCFEGGDGQFGDTRYRNPAWDGILRDLVINSDVLPEAHYYERLNEAIRNKEESCEYLIISPDDPAILAWADTLKQFRTRQGILTKVVTLTDCGSNEPDDIRNFIRNAYENWAIPPAAVLLFGENHKGAPEFGPKPFVLSSPPSNVDGTIYNYPSDNPIADMNGDSIPDLAISRLAIKYPSEYQRQITKLIDYELNPPTDPHYYDHPIITSGYQEEKWFMITSQCVNGFFCNQLGKHPTNNYMVFDQLTQYPTPPDSIWSTGPNTEAVLDYFGPNGTNYIPSDISYLDNWSYMWNSALLTDAINEDSFFVFYRDHSSQGSWCCPWFSSGDWGVLQAKKPTFVFSIGCLTNNFWDNWSACLSESLLSLEVGAIGVIGANTVTFSHFNDLITWGMLDYFWPEYMPTLASQTEPDFNYPSYALVAGKLFLQQQAFLPYATNTAQVEKTQNLFSFLGDTYLNIFTEMPQTLSVEAASFHHMSQNEYMVTAEEGALICIAKGGEILHIMQAIGQTQTFSLPAMAVGEHFDVTVTKPKCLRFHQEVTIIPSSGPYVLVDDYDFRDANGNGNLEFDEEASIDLMLYNAGVDLAENTEIHLVCESPFVELIDSTAICSRLEHEAHITLQGAFNIRVSRDIPDQTDVAFKIILDNGVIVQEIPFQKTVSAPILVIRPIHPFVTNDGQPTNHIGTEGTTQIGFQIANTGHCDSGPLMVDFNLMVPFLSVETSHYTLENLSPDSLADITFRVMTLPNDIEGAWPKSMLCVRSSYNEVVYEPQLQYGGLFENFETDTLNPLFTWESYANYPWQYTEADAAEGRRSFEITLPKNKVSRLLITAEEYLPAGIMSFYCRTDFRAPNTLEELIIKESSSTGTTFQYVSSEDWGYFEHTIAPQCTSLSFQFVMHSEHEFGARIDKICFSPPHHPIAFAGPDLVSCKEATIELHDAYAYDCDSIIWTTDGDGYFENDTIINTLYYPGSQDLANGDVTLTIHAWDEINAMVSSIKITLLDEIHLEGAIVGDSVVNKYQQPVSHYSVERQQGIQYMWQLEPAEAGYIHGQGDEVDILWNLNEYSADAILSVTADNGCSTEPMTKHISLIGYSTPEWTTPSFDLFPNPTDGKINLVIGETLQGKTVIEIYNLLGECVLAKKINHLQKDETLALDLNHLVSGLYIIKLSSENGSCSKKVSVR